MIIQMLTLFFFISNLLTLIPSRTGEARFCCKTAPDDDRCKMTCTEGTPPSIPIADYGSRESRHHVAPFYPSPARESSSQTARNGGWRGRGPGRQPKRGAATKGINPFPSIAAGATADWPVTFAHGGLLDSRPFQVRLSDLLAFCANYNHHAGEK